MENMNVSFKIFFILFVWSKIYERGAEIHTAATRHGLLPVFHTALKPTWREAINFSLYCSYASLPLTAAVSSVVLPGQAWVDATYMLQYSSPIIQNLCLSGLMYLKSHFLASSFHVFSHNRNISWPVSGRETGRDLRGKQHECVHRLYSVWVDAITSTRPWWYLETALYIVKWAGVHQYLL